MNSLSTLSSPFRDLLPRLTDSPVAVLGHVRPDGDCIGSQVALCRMLRAKGVDAFAVNEHPVPRNLQPFVGDTPFLLAEDANLEGRTLVSTDCADRKRFGKAFEPRLGPVTGNIDHHISNSNYAEVNLIDGESCATGEILAGIFFDLDLPMDPVTAQALYIGIATDTGQFRFRGTSRRTFEIVGRLMDAGADPAEAALHLYENESFAKLKLLQKFIESFERHADGRICLGVIDADMYTTTGADTEDTEGLVDYARSIDGVAIGVLLEDRHGSIKGSLRAKDPACRVDLIAREFNGGGHAAAAGFNMDEPLASLKPRLIEALQKSLSAGAPA